MKKTIEKMPRLRREATGNRDLVYGTTGDEASLAFLPRHEAERLAAYRAVMSTAKTWRTFYRRLPQAVGEEVRQLMDEERPKWSDPFDWNVLLDIGWPEMVEQVMARTVPTDLLEKYGGWAHDIFGEEWRVVHACHEA